MANPILARRGLEENLPILRAGEPAVVTNSGKEKFYFGTGTKNIQLARQDEMLKALDNKTDKEALVWFSPVLLNSAGSADAAFCKLGNVVYLRGWMHPAPVEVPLFILPLGFRPSKWTTFIVPPSKGDTSRVMRLSIASDTGEVMFNDLTFGTAPLSAGTSINCCFIAG